MAMEVHPGKLEPGADSSATAVVQRAGPEGQGQLFPDALAYPTYGDTDKIPAVGGSGRHADGLGPARWLRVAVALVALAVIAAGTALGLVKAGVIGNGNGSGSGTTGAPPAHHQTATNPKAPLLTATSTGAGTASYSIDVPAYQVTVTTSTGRSWVSIGTVGQQPSFAGILEPATSQKAILLGPSQVDVGAGGTRVVVTSGHRSVTLTPLSAPFSYQFTPKR
jgi:hypothetical protein